ncbi:membrane protein PM19L-like [Humulus lupulus]|uniref:membrane protein PM19L-like n=1 Tax=Humulus lupulus TaxID=3486 RepID=UPI002B400787|nr:membrane protein PM19L-like [Humulus lupulus]
MHTQAQLIFFLSALCSNFSQTSFPPLKMVDNKLFKYVSLVLLVLNFCMYVIVLSIGGNALNRAIDYGFVIGPDFHRPDHFAPIYFPFGNEATGFFVTFAVLAAVIGIASVVAGINHIRFWTAKSLPSAASAAIIAWTLTLLAMGFACKEIELESRNSRLRTMEAFIIILTATQLSYVVAIHSIVITT